MAKAPRKKDVFKGLPERADVEAELQEAVQRVARLRALLAVHTAGDPVPIDPPTSPPCNCPDPCAEAGAFSLLYCEDGKTQHTDPPNVKSVLVYDPSIPGFLWATWPP